MGSSQAVTVLIGTVTIRKGERSMELELELGRVGLGSGLGGIAFRIGLGGRGG